MDPEIESIDEIKVIAGESVEETCDKIYSSRDFQRDDAAATKIFGEDNVPLCGEIVDEYVDRPGYLNNCIDLEFAGFFGNNAKVDWSVSPFVLFGNAGVPPKKTRVAARRCINDVILWYPKGIRILPGLVDRPLYRSYDYGSDPRGNDPHRYKQLVASLRDQLASGLVRAATPEESDTPPSESGGTSWTTNPMIDNFDRDTKVEVMATPGSINIPATIFVNALYIGGSTGFEVKIKPGAKLPVTAFHYTDPDTGEKKVDRHDGKIVEFARAPSRNHR
jgi:hypothetical protein